MSPQQLQAVVQCLTMLSASAIIRCADVHIGRTGRRTVKAVLVSDRSDNEYILSGDSIHLGRAPDNDIVLESSGVSRHQARIAWIGSEYILEDLDSANGTWVNGKRLSERSRLVDGDSVTFGDVSLTFRTVDASAVTVRARPPQATGVVTVLFTDLEGSTATRVRVGDTKAQEIVHAHNAIVREALSRFQGKEIKHTGDGIMASFPVASGALSCAIAIQQSVTSHVRAHPESPLQVYIGLNAGEPIVDEQDLFGTSVDLAARICERAEPGQILVSDVVRQLAAGKPFLFSDLGKIALRGFEDPVNLWEVSWRKEG